MSYRSSTKLKFFLFPSVFEQYQKARTQFVQTVAELASRPQNIETLQNAGVMSLLRPLLLDIVPTIQQTAALALGRLANYNDDLAEAVVKGDILPQLVYSLAEQNVSFAVMSDTLRSWAGSQQFNSPVPHLLKFNILSTVDGELDCYVIYFADQQPVPRV